MNQKHIQQPNRQELLLLKSAIAMHGSHVDISRYDETFFVKTLHRRMKETLCQAFGDYFLLIDKSLDEASRFIESFQISYSEFFRNLLTYSVLERIVLPLIVQKQKDSNKSEVRIWSCACAAGQEPYSLAILMEEIKERRQEALKYRIFTTDQSQLQVHEAHEGKYMASDLDNVTLKRVSRWFDKHGNTYMVKKELKNNIDFSVFDLFNEQYSSPPASIFGDFDLVVCANLLFYYKNEEREKIIEKVSNGLHKDGFLITGETEREILIRFGYKEVYPQSGVFRR